jgi:hypothetical protein
MRVYPCLPRSVEAFVQRLALDYVQYGYHFYSLGSVPEGMDAHQVDRAIIDRYRINVSRWTRYRKAKEGLASVHYLRFGRFFVIIASEGKHLFREREKEGIKDIREVPIRFAGYSIGYRRSKGGGSWHPSVRIEKNEYRLLKKQLVKASTELSVKKLIRVFRGLPFEPYAPVRQQLLSLLRLVNARRKTASLSLLPLRAVRYRRRSVKRFQFPPAEENPGWNRQRPKRRRGRKHVSAPAGFPLEAPRQGPWRSAPGSETGLSGSWGLPASR